MTRLATRIPGTTELAAPCPYCCRSDDGRRIRINDDGQFTEHLAAGGGRCSGSGRSIASLGVVLPGPTEDVDGRAVELLVQHQRKDAGGCLCGWSVLGASYAEHVVEQLRGWGLLRDELARG